MKDKNGIKVLRKFAQKLRARKSHAVQPITDYLEVIAICFEVGADLVEEFSQEFN